MPLQALGNRPGDIYVDRVAAGSSTTPTQILRSNQPYVQVLGFSLGDLVFSDIDRNGRYDAGIDAPIPGVTVQVEDEFGTLVATTDHGRRWPLDRGAPRSRGRASTMSSAPATGWSSRPASSRPGGPLLGYWAAPNPTNPDLDQNEPVDHHARDLGEPATFGSSSALVTLSADASGAVIRGHEPLGDNVADLGNPLMGDSFTQLTVDMGFEPLPRLAMVKTITSGPTPLANGNVRIVYRVRVTNTGPGAGRYDLVDQLRFGTGVTIVSSSRQHQPRLEWRVSSTQLADRTPSSPAMPPSTTPSPWMSTSIPATATYTSTDCLLTGGETGTGLRNDASFSWTDGHHGPQTGAQDVCAPLPILSITKVVVGTPVVSGANTTITYDITVTNRGGGAGQYDLDDQLRFGTGTSLGTRSVSNIPPGTIVTNATWNGTTSLRVVTGQSIAAQTTVSPTTHVYRVVATATVSTNTATWNSSNCTLETPETNTGFRNEGRLIAGTTTQVDACAPFAAIRIAKTLVSGSPVANGDGTFTISYNLTVSNLGAGATTYDLSDRLRFGAGVTITSATVGNTSPGSIITNAAWNGTITQQVVVTGQAIAAATNATTPTAHVYRVTAIASVDEGTATYASSDCSLGADAGTGFRNDGTVAFPGGAASVNICAPFPIIGLTKVLGTVALQPDGSYAVPYTVTVTNRGAGAGTYSLSDGFHFGTGVNIVPGTTTISATPVQRRPVADLERCREPADRHQPGDRGGRAAQPRPPTMCSPSAPGSPSTRRRPRLPPLIAPSPVVRPAPAPAMTPRCSPTASPPAPTPAPPFPILAITKTLSGLPSRERRRHDHHPLRRHRQQPRRRSRHLRPGRPAPLRRGRQHRVRDRHQHHPGHHHDPPYLEWHDQPAGGHGSGDRSPGACRPGRAACLPRDRASDRRRRCNDGDFRRLHPGPRRDRHRLPK